MLAKLLLLLTIVPAVELVLLLQVGQWMGLWPTVGLIFATGIAGAILGKSQGLKAWRRIQQDLGAGKLPSDSILDGLAVLIAGAFLITPGVMTDITGLLLLIPPARRPVKAYLKRRFRKALDKGTVEFISFDPFGGPGPSRTTTRTGDDVIDVTPGEDSTRKGGADEPEPATRRIDTTDTD